MATLTTSPQIVGRNEAGTIRTYLYAWYDGQSGNTCTVHTRLTAVSAGVTYTGSNKRYSMQLGSYDSGSVEWKYQPMYSWEEYTVAEASQQYSGGSQISASAGFWSYVYGDANVWLSENTYVPVFTTPPTGLAINIAEVYPNGAKFNVSISGYGTPSGAAGRYIEAAILAQSTYGATYKFNIAYNTTASAITVTNASTHGTLSVKANTKYWYGCFASNTQASNSKVQGQFVTTAEAPTITFVSATDTTATMSYTTKADGGVYAKAIQYSLDNGATWNTGATVTGSAASSGTFVISGLLSGATYTMLTRVSTTAGTTAGESLSFDTLVGEEDNKNILYGEADNKAKEVRILYGSVNDETVPIIKLYGSAPDPDYFNVAILRTSSPWAVNNIVAATLNAKLETSHPEIWENRNRFYGIEVYSVPTTPRRYFLTMIYKDNTKVGLGDGNESWLNGYGIFVRTLPPSLASQTTREYVLLKNRPIAKLCYQGFRHVDYSNNN